MNRIKYSSGILLALLVISSLPVTLASAQTENWTLIERGPNFERWFNGTHYRWRSAPLWILNQSSGEYVPYLFINKYASDGYYQVQTGLIGARIYDYYTVFFDPNMTEVRLYDERWEVQKWKKTGKGGWDDLGAQSGTPIFTISKFENGINITRSFHSWAGWLNVTFVFYEGSPLKHEIVFKSEISSTETFRVIQKWSGIVGTKVKHCKGEDKVSSAIIINSTWFKFEKADGRLSVFEDQSIMSDKLEPVAVDVTANGLKATFIFGNWSLPSTEVLSIDPVTYTASPPTQDVFVHEGYPNNNYNGIDQLEVQSYSGNDCRVFVEFNISSIPSGVTIQSAVLRLYFYSSYGAGTRTYEIQRITESWDETTVTWNTQPSVDATIVTQTIDDSPSYWWNVTVTSIFQSGNTIGFRIKDETEDSGLQIYRMFRNKEYDGYDAKLEVVYNSAPTIGEFQAPSTVYANKYFFLNATINDADGVTDFVNATVELSNGIILKWDNATDTFSEHQDTNNYCTLDASNSLKTSVNSTAYKLSFKVKLSWNYTEGSVNVVSTNTKVFDSNDASGSNSQTGIFTFEDDLIIHSDASVDDSRINPGDSITFNGTIYYQGTTTVPEDISGITVKVELSGTQKGSDSSPTSGIYSISVTGETSVANHSYIIYAVTDENSVQNRTVYVVVDQLNASSVTIDLSNEQLNVTLVYAYDASSVSSGTVNFHGTNATTDSNGIATFDLSSLSDFDYNQVAYGVTDSSYGITSTIQNQTIPLAKKTHLVQGNENITISSLSWDTQDKQLSFSATASGEQSIKVRHSNAEKPYYIKINTVVYEEGSHWTWSTPTTTITDTFSTKTFLVSWTALVTDTSSSGGGESTSTTSTSPISTTSGLLPEVVKKVITPTIISIPKHAVGLIILGLLFVALSYSIREDYVNISFILGFIATIYIINLLFVWVLIPQGMFPSDLEPIKDYLFYPPVISLEAYGLQATEVEIMQILTMTLLFGVFASAVVLLVWSRD